jgi:transposase
LARGGNALLSRFDAGVELRKKRRSVAVRLGYGRDVEVAEQGGGNVADITAAATLVSAVTPPGELVGDKGYDANHLRRFLAERGTAAVIPSTSSRKVAIPHDAERYRLRNVIERTFCRIKDFRGIATRYDKTARNFLAAVCLVSTVTYWA